MAHRNARLVGLPVTWLAGDVRSLPLRPGGFDLVVSNPPFYPPGWGRTSPAPRRAAVTHALHGDVADFARAAASALVPRGAVVFLYDASRLASLLLALADAGLAARADRDRHDDHDDERAHDDGGAPEPPLPTGAGGEHHRVEGPPGELTDPVPGVRELEALLLPGGGVLEEEQLQVRPFRPPGEDAQERLLLDRVGQHDVQGGE